MPKDEFSFFKILTKSLFYGAIFGFIGILGMKVIGGYPISLYRSFDLVCPRIFYQEWLKIMAVGEFITSLNSAISRIPKWVTGSYLLFLYLFILRTLNPSLRLKGLIKSNISIYRLLSWVFIFTPLILSGPTIIILLIGYLIQSRLGICCSPLFFLILTLISMMAGISCGFLWVIWSKKGIFANLSLFDKDKGFWSPFFVPQKGLTLLRLFVTGFSVGPVLWLLYGFGYWVLDEINSFSLNFTEVELTWIIYLEILIYFAWLFIPPIVAGMLVYGLSKFGLRSREYIARLIMPLGLITVFVGSGLFAYRVAVNEYDYTKSFHQELGIPTIEPKEKKVLIFTKNRVRVQIERNDFYSISGGFSLDNSKKYLDRAKDYLRAKNYRTTFVGEGVRYLTTGYNQNWLPQELFRFQLDLLENGASTEGGWLLIGLSRYAEYRPELLEMADRLENEEIFYHGSIGSKKLGDIYLHLGNYEKARYWYGKSDEKPIPEIDSQKPFLKNGVIKGQVLIDGKPVEGIRVGLAWFHPETDPEIMKVRFRGSLTNTVASTTTNSRGEFGWNNLLEGEYHLVLMADKKLLPEPLSVDKKFGKLSLSAKTPLIDLGTVKIEFRK